MSPVGPGARRSASSGTFADLGKLGTGAYDLCICLRSLLYAQPRARAEAALCELGRAASKAVVADVASKHGMILQLGGQFEVSAGAIVEMLTTGTTPPAKPEHGRVVYSCFSSEELRRAAEKAGLTVQRVVGFGITETLEVGTSTPIAVDEGLRIERLLQAEEGMLDSFPNLLALCTK